MPVGFSGGLCYYFGLCDSGSINAVSTAVPMMARFALLTLLLTGSVAAWAESIGWAVNSRGNEIDSQRVDALWRIDLETGAAEYVGWTSYLDLEGLAFGAEGDLFGADDDSKTLVRVSQSSGLAIPVGGQINRNNMNLSLSENLDFGMAMDCANQAWVVSSAQQSLFKADLESGELTLVGEPGSLGAPISDLAFLGEEAFGIGVGLNGDRTAAAPNLYSVDPSTGQATLVGPLGEAALPYFNAGLDFDEEGVLWAVTDRRAVPGGDFPSAILRIDPISGTAEFVAETVIGLESLAVGPAAACDLRGAVVTRPVPVLSLEGLLGLSLILLMFGAAQVRSRSA